jgi:hypothetical protein
MDTFVVEFHTDTQYFNNEDRGSVFHRNFGIRLQGYTYVATTRNTLSENHRHEHLKTLTSVLSDTSLSDN